MLYRRPELGGFSKRPEQQKTDNLTIQLHAQFPPLQIPTRWSDMTSKFALVAMCVEARETLHTAFGFE
jgi:hypothetical protein